MPPLRQTRWAGEELSQWRVLMNLSDVAVREGVLSATTTDRDPAFVSQPLELRASQATKVFVEMRLNRPVGAAQLFWSTVSMPKPNESTAVPVDTIPDGQWRRYEFPVGKNPNWSGCVTSLRFDPGDQKDVAVEIRAISVE
jgi:hypothetical protein